jgi:hypothetical protein
MEEQENTKFWWENLKERDQEDLTADRITLKCISKKLYWNVWTGFIWLRVETCKGRL